MTIPRTLSTVIAGLALGVCGAAQGAGVIDGSTLGYYNAGLGDLAPAPDHSAATNLGTWLTAAAPSGGTWSAAPQAIPSTWAINTETAIVYAINAGSGLSNVHIDLGVDNGIYVWLNGSYLFGAMAPGGSTPGEYGIDIASLAGGTHSLQILREDHGGLTG